MTDEQADAIITALRVDTIDAGLGSISPIRWHCILTIMVHRIVTADPTCKPLYAAYDRSNRSKP